MLKSNLKEGFLMVTNKQIEAISDILASRMDMVSIKTLNMIADRIRRIGAISPSDAHKLEQMRLIGADLQKINQYLADATNRNVKDIEKIFETFAKNNYDFLSRYYDASGVTQIPFEENIQLQRIIRANAIMTAKTFMNLSNNTVFALKNSSGGIVYKPVSKAYTDIVDKAITSVQSGVSDYNTEMRGMLKQFADSGVRTVEYKSGYSRDIFSATKMNLMDGIRQMNIEVLNQAGKEFGANGMEIEPHELCAPDHLPVQGRQFTNEEYEKLNSDVPFEDVEGRKYGPIARPIGMWNCRHISFPIIVGVNKPIHSDKELEEIQKRNTEKSYEIDGKKYTKYEVSQIMRKLESEIRKKKNELNVFKKSGDAVGAIKARGELRTLQNKYKQVEDSSKLVRRPLNTSV